MTGTVGANTSLLIDYFEGHEGAVAFVEKHHHLLVISEVVIYEFLCGNLSVKQQDRFLALMERFPTAPFLRGAALHASKVYRDAKKRGRSLGHQDCLVAGSYLAAGVSRIATDDTKHFAEMKGVKAVGY